MADDGLVKILVDLDAKQAIKNLSELNDKLKKIGDIDDLKSLAATMLKLGSIGAVAAVGVLAVKTALDMAREAEHIRQINTSFEALAKSAGLSAEVIKEKLTVAAKGLVDETDLLEAANKAIVTMGSNASHVGETMEIARKATALFGGDLISNFESINQALASGNARALRQFGIIVDSEKAQKDYAKSIGVSVEFLTEAGKKQAVFNASLEQARQKLSGVDESTLQTTEAMKKFWIALKDIKEIAILVWDKMYGPAVKGTIESLAGGVHTLALRFKSAFGSANEQAEAQKQLLDEHKKSQREWIEWQLKQLNGAEMYKNRINELRAELEKLDEDQEKNAMAEMKRQARQFKPSEAPAVESAPQIDYEKLKAERAKFEKDLLTLTQQRISEEAKIAETVAEVDVIHYQQREEINRQAEERLAQIKRDFLDKGIISKEQYAQAEYQIEQTKNAQIHALEQSLETDRIKALELANSHSKNAAEGMRSAFALAAANGKKDFLDYGKTGTLVFNSIKGNAAKAFQALGDGSKNAGEAMRGFMFGAIADIAEAKGQELLAWGIAEMNPGAIAGGGALMALSSLLRSKAGGAGGGLGGGGGGGGPAAGPVAETTEPKAPAIQEQSRRTVSINVQGNYFETEQTRTRMMEMIREAGDFTDFNLKQIGQA